MLMIKEESPSPPRAIASSRITTLAGISVGTTAVIAAAAVATTSVASTSTVIVAPSTMVIPRISVASAATASSTTTGTPSRTAKGTPFLSDRLQPIRNLLIRLLEQIKQLADDVLVVAVEERGRDTGVASTASTTDTVDVVVNVRREIVVDDVGDVGNVETTSGDGSSDHDGRAARTERSESLFAFALGAVTVDRGSGEVGCHEEVGEDIGGTLGLDEDQGQAAILTLGGEDVEKHGTLVLVLDELDALGDVLRGRADASNGKEDVILQEIPSEDLDLSGEGGREHEGLTLLSAWHILLLDDPPNLRLETHVQHAISLIKNEVPDIGETDAATFDEIDQSTGSSAQQVASALDLAELHVDVSTTVNHSGFDPTAVSELASLVVDLADEFASRGEDECGRVSLAGTTVSGSVVLDGCGTRAGGERLREDGEKESSGFTGTRLGASHEVATCRCGVEN